MCLLASWLLRLLKRHDSTEILPLQPEGQRSQFTEIALVRLISRKVEFHCDVIRPFLDITASVTHPRMAQTLGRTLVKSLRPRFASQYLKQPLLVEATGYLLGFPDVWSGQTALSGASEVHDQRDLVLLPADRPATDPTQLPDKGVPPHPRTAAWRLRSGHIASGCWWRPSYIRRKMTGLAGALTAWNPVSLLIITTRQVLIGEMQQYLTPFTLVLGGSLFVAFCGLIAFRFTMPDLVVRMGG